MYDTKEQAKHAKGYCISVIAVAKSPRKIKRKEWTLGHRWSFLLHGLSIQGHVGESMAAEMGDTWSPAVCSQEAQTDQHQCSACFVLFF